MIRYIPTKSDLVGAFVLLFLLIPLVALAYIGFFTRYMADDYCTAARINEIGFLKSQMVWYSRWTGRFSFSFFVGVAELIGPLVVRFLPLSALICWISTTGWLVYQIAVIARWPRPILTSMILAELFVFTTLNSTAHIVQSLYWQSGMLTYTVPLILFTLYAGIICRALRYGRRTRAISPVIIGAFVLMFIAGGFSEAYLCMQTCGLLIGVVICYKLDPGPYRRAALPPFIAGMVGSLIAAGIVILSPGNIVRQSYFPKPPDGFRLVELSLYYAAGFIPYTIIRSPLTILLSVMLPALFGYYQGINSNAASKVDFRKVVHLLFSLWLVGFILILASTVPGIYGTSSFLPERARLIPQFVIIGVAVATGYFSGAALSQRLSELQHKASSSLAVGSALMIALLLLVTISAARRTFSLATRARDGAFAWDRMDLEVRVAKGRGESDLVVPAVDDSESRLGARWTELQIERDAQNWKNRCAAKYYAVKSIRAQ